LDFAVRYQPLREPRHQKLRVRGLETHVTYWGAPAPAGASPVVLLHGWLDVGDTFQFLIDAFERDWPCVALDWRGFGRTEWPQEGYSFADYLGDLDALLEQVAPDAPAHLVGHSMGGNIASLYAGLRPERVRSLTTLEGLGLARTTPQDAPERLRKWLKQIKSPAREKTYSSFEQLAAVVQYRYPRFAPEVAAYVAERWSTPTADGRISLAADPRHHWVNPVRYKREDAESIWSEIRAPIRVLLGDDSEYLHSLGEDGSIEALRRALPGADIRSVADAGHMLHIERPGAVAALVEGFLAVN
jgi:pimeloyl-ACP methyl ester carboxylesterase